MVSNLAYSSCRAIVYNIISSIYLALVQQKSALEMV
jgi:hypothetical protein